MPPQDVCTGTIRRRQNLAGVENEGDMDKHVLNQLWTAISTSRRLQDVVPRENTDESASPCTPMDVAAAMKVAVGQPW